VSLVLGLRHLFPLRLLSIFLVLFPLLHLLNEEAAVDEEELLEEKKETAKHASLLKKKFVEKFILFGERNKFIENEFLSWASRKLLFDTENNLSSPEIIK